MHTYSHAPLADGQKNYDQASVRAGHTVYARDIRQEDIPAILSIEERNSTYLISTANGLEVVENYANVIKFIQEGTLVEIPGTNGESWRIIDSATNNPITGWIDPSDKPVNQTTLSNGYEIRLKTGVDTYISRNYGWSFDTFNGILKFSSEFNPKMQKWTEDAEFGTPVIEGFIYVGKTVEKKNEEIDQSIIDTKNDFNAAFASTLIIQPFRFNTEIMVPIGDPYQKEYTDVRLEKCTWFQTMSFVVPGFCFQIASLDDDETIITEMRHLRNGDTQIFIDVPWDTINNKPIVRFIANEDVPEAGTKFPVIGTYKFIASSFLRADGFRIPVAEIIDYNNPPVNNPDVMRMYFPATPVPGTAGSSPYEYIDQDRPSEYTSPYPVGTPPYMINLGASAHPPRF